MTRENRKEGELLEDRPLLKQFQERRTKGIKACAPIWDRATENHRFAAPGESQWREGDRKLADKNKVAALTFNEIHPIVQHLSGRQQLDRHQRVYIPRNRQVAEWAESITEIDRALVESCDGSQHESRAFKNGPCIGSIGWLRYEINFLDEPDGKLTIREAPIWSMIWPAHEAREMNLGDRNWHIHGFWLPKAEVRALWPRGYKKLSAMLGEHWSISRQPERSHRIPWRTEEDSASDPTICFDRAADNFWIELYEYREVVHKFRVAMLRDPGMTYAMAQQIIESGEAEDDQVFQVETISADDFAKLEEEHFKRTAEQIPRTYSTPQPMYAYRYAIICGEEILEQGDIPIKSWTLLPITAYPFEQPDKVEWRSLVDALRDPQLWKNVFTSMLLRFIQANPKGLLIYERGLFRNKGDAMAEWGRMDGTVEVDRGRLSGSANPPFMIHNGAGSPMNGLLESMVAMSDAAIPRLAGFNPGALGQVGNDLRRISGEVVAQVREAATASQAILFDSFATYRKAGGDTLLRFVAHFFEPEDLERIIGEMATYEEVEGPNGEVQRVSKIPPKEMWRSANWYVSTQEQTPAPDRLRAQFEALSASGGLKLMIETGAMVAEDLVEMIPDLSEDRRRKMLTRIKAAGEQEGGEQASLEVLGQVVAALVQSAANLDDQQREALLTALQGGGEQQVAA